MAKLTNKPCYDDSGNSWKICEDGAHEYRKAGFTLWPNLRFRVTVMIAIRLTNHRWNT